MQYRRPLLHDFEKMIALQNNNLVSALSKVHQSDGFLSASLTAEQFQEMDKDLCVIVCDDLEKICGYLCVSSVDYNKKIPLVAAMIERFSTIEFQGKPLSAYQSFISGPVCVDRAHRGQGIFINLYQHLMLVLRQEHPELELATTLIANENPRSIHAHKKLGMETVGEFKFNNKDFSILVMPVE